MSAQFIIRYAGNAVSIRNGVPNLVADDAADKFVSEADAWYAAFKADFNPAHTQVMNLYVETQRAAGGK